MHAILTLATRMAVSQQDSASVSGVKCDEPGVIIAQCYPVNCGHM